MPATATVSISGMIVVQLMASRAVARSICQKPSAAQSSRKETRDPQARAMRMARLPPKRSAAKLMAGVNRMRMKSGVARSTAIWSASRSRQWSQIGRYGR
jgi:hypothetical protein